MLFIGNSIYKCMINPHSKYAGEVELEYDDSCFYLTPLLYPRYNASFLAPFHTQNVASLLLKEISAMHGD